MTMQELWSVLMGADENPKLTLAEELSRTSFDELMEIDLRQSRYRIIYHVEDKYVGNLPEGDFDRLFSFAVDHFVHPDEAEAYRAFIDPDTLVRRLRESPTPGALRGDFRFLSTGGGWIRTRQLLVYGPDLGLSEDMVHCYVYDIDRQYQRHYGLVPQPGENLRREEVTGLLDGMDYFRAVQRRMTEFSEGWCIIYIRIDHHKLFTDWYGLDSGQYLLTHVAEILRRRAREVDGSPGYLGEENFCMVAPYDMAWIKDMFREVHQLVSSVSAIEGFLPVFGVAEIDGSSNDIRTYFNHAGLAAEEETSTRIRLYDAEVHQKNSLDYRLLYSFRQALEAGEITFWLQPQVGLPDQRIVGAESLARWIRPDGTTVSPAVFVPLLEKYGLVTRLDTYIWDAVCRWLRDWIDRGMTPVPISVNVSRLDLFAIDVPAHFAELLRKYDLPASYIKIEITESAYAEDSNVVEEVVTRFRELGLMVLMDDFGSGYSSLNMLRSLNVDIIKLDAQFLQLNRTDEKKGVSILESIVNMTRNLSTPIIVEGVETMEQVHFLSDLGCRYMQGFYFYRPMPVQDFEALCASGQNVDTRGFVFNANLPLRIREFMDENIYSDAMLNNILGPVAFYARKGDNVDILRYNQQFYQLVGIDLEEFQERRNHITDYLPRSDREKLLELMDYAEAHHTLGAEGVIRAYRPNGALVSLLLHLYYIDEDEHGKKFYTSARDVTEQQFISVELPGGYYRCSLDNGFVFYYISKNFLNMTGYSQVEIQTLFDNRLINMVHPEDVSRLVEQSQALSQGELEELQPYRLRRKRGDYIYVAEQSRITDAYGVPCWQCILIDVTEVMHVRNQMRVLSKFFTEEILFLSRVGENLVYEVAVHGLAGQLQMSPGEFQQALNSGIFCQWIEGHQDIPHNQYTRQFVDRITGSPAELTVHLPNQNVLHLSARADQVRNNSTIEYIVVLREIS